MKVFLSYQPQANEPFAQKLGAELTRRGITPRSINLRLEYAERLPKSVEALDMIVRECNHVIPLLSRDYVADRWLQRELGAFNSLEMSTEKSNLIIPAIIEKCDPPPILDDKIADELFVDFTKLPFDQAVTGLISLFSGVRQAFVIMKYGNELLDEVFEKAIVPVLSGLGYTPVRADKASKPGEITAQIYDQINGSELVLADLTCRSPNCYFEAGYAYARSRSLILSAKKGTKIPFNLTTHHFLLWKDAEDLAEQLKEYIEKNIVEKKQ